MPKVKLNWDDLTIPEKLQRAKQIIAALTGNPNFPNPNPTLAQLSAAADALEAAAASALTARQVAKTATTEQQQKENTLDGMMGQLVGHIESISGGDETKIQSAGMDLRAISTPGTEPPSTPKNLFLTEGDHAAEIDGQWDRDVRARSYVVEISTDPPTQTSWKLAKVVTVSRVTLDGLVSGQRYWVRVAAVNAKGQSGWSDPATKIAP